MNGTKFRDKLHFSIFTIFMPEFSILLIKVICATAFMQLAGWFPGQCAVYFAWYHFEFNHYFYVLFHWFETYFK